MPDKSPPRNISSIISWRKYFRGSTFAHARTAPAHAFYVRTYVRREGDNITPPAIRYAISQSFYFAILCKLEDPALPY